MAETESPVVLLRAKREKYLSVTFLALPKDTKMKCQMCDWPPWSGLSGGHLSEEIALKFKSSISIRAGRWRGG